MSPSVPGNELICCACMLKLTWQEDLPWRAAVDCAMAERVAGIADSLLHTALPGHLHLLKVLSNQLLSSLTPAWSCSGLPDLSCFCQVFCFMPPQCSLTPTAPAGCPSLASSFSSFGSQQEGRELLRAHSFSWLIRDPGTPSPSSHLGTGTYIKLPSQVSWLLMLEAVGCD